MGGDPLPFDAILFDLDGVLTATARLHEAAWKRTFDDYLAARAERTGGRFEPFTAEDYARHLDGKLREDGVRDFLASRGISLPEGSPDSSPEEETIHGIGKRKNRLIEELIGPGTIEVFPASLATLRRAKRLGMKTAVVSASANCKAVLAAVGIEDQFDVVVDGIRAAELRLPGKPAPDTFLQAAQELGVPPARCILVEDAVAGVRAGRSGGFGLVIGLDRRGQWAELLRAGASVVVSDLWTTLHLFDPQASTSLRRLLRTQRSLARMAQATRIEPWKFHVDGPAVELAPELESLFALSNGWMGIRGATEEGTPSFRPGVLLNGFYETWPIVYGEEAYGFARTGQTILNAPDGFRIRLIADDAHFDPAHDDLESYRRTLHLDTGTLERRAVWRLHDGARLAVRSRRIASLADRHLACVIYEVEALDRPVQVTISSELADPHHLESTDDAMDPRRRHRAFRLETVHREITEDGALLAYRTQRSGLALACGISHVVRSGSCRVEVRDDGTVVRAVHTASVSPGVTLRIEKFVAYHHSATRFSGELLFRLAQTLSGAKREGAHSVVARHEAVVRQFWQDADIQLEGSEPLQFALRFGLFHLMQATLRSEGYGVPAKGLTGEGYEGHYFWDTEMYLVPVLVYTRPMVARNLLVHRWQMLPQARERARALGHRGALFPWRTISGEEASASFATGTAQYHINADIAFAVRKYVKVTGDREFYERFGAEILVETARLWADLGFFSERKGGRFVINGVTGPDEYSSLVDNNAFTNLMARENLQMAAAAVEELRTGSPDAYDALVAATRLEPDEPARWRAIADAMYVPYDERQRVHLQDDTFLDQKPWDFESTPPERYPLLLHYHPLVLYRHQVIKQPDVMLVAFLLGNEFTLEEKRRIFEHYDPLTTGDSSLSECVQSLVACEVGALEMGHQYLLDSAFVDLADRNGNVRDGMHLAACGGTWMAVVYGFGGLRDYDGRISFDPKLPPNWRRLRFRLRIRDALLEVELRQGEAAYRLLEGKCLPIVHRGESIVVWERSEQRMPFPRTIAE